MQTNYRLLAGAIAVAAGLQTIQAQLVIPSDGSDGMLNPPATPTNVVIDLSQAVTANWDANNSANAGRGIYDPAKWAVVFKYSSVNIPQGVRVTFKNHPSHAPVVWLVQGGVTNRGTICLDGETGKPSGVGALTPAEPGPGGFRGGVAGPAGYGSGFGPGGGERGNPAGASGSFATVYSNPGILPLIGGSGGGASLEYGRTSAGAGGGALLVASSDAIALFGRITAAGGQLSGWSGLGSGGAVRLLCSRVVGGGEINCLPEGRIRIEATVLDPALKTYPETVKVDPRPDLIWPPTTTPTARIVSVGTNAAPIDPTAPLTAFADVAIENDKPVVVTIETKNFPLEGIVELRVAEKWGGAGWKRASFASGNQAIALWRATNTFAKGYSALQVRATAP